MPTHSARVLPTSSAIVTPRPLAAAPVARVKTAAPAPTSRTAAVVNERPTP